jgi:hypothetical protein
MKKLNWIIAFVVGIAFLSSCLDGDEPQPVPAGGMTFINAYGDADRLLYRLDGNTVQEYFNPLPYRNFGFALLYARENRSLEIYASAEDRIADTTFTVRDSLYYSSIVYGTHEDPKHFITEDRVPEGTADPTTIAAVRFFNLANTAHRVTLRIGDADPLPAFRDRPMETPATGKAGENFIPVPTGAYALSVVNEDGETLATRDIEIEAGVYSSIFLTGDEGDPSTYYIGVVRL